MELYIFRDIYSFTFSMAHTDLELKFLLPLFALVLEKQACTTMASLGSIKNYVSWFSILFCF